MIASCRFLRSRQRRPIGRNDTQKNYGPRKRKRLHVIHMEPLFMSATTYSPTHFRVQYRPATNLILSLCGRRRAATSVMSCGLPAASLLAIRSSLEIKNALRPLVGSIRVSTRFGHARSKSMPSISGRTSTARGARPMRKNLLRSAKSAGASPSNGAPNSSNA